LDRVRDPTRRREAARRRAAVIELCAGLAAELGAGGTARESLNAASLAVPDVAHLGAVAAAPHGDVAQALQTAAGRPGGAGLLSLAACWRVSERSGSALAPSVSRLAATLRDEEQVRREVAAQLAGPRATSVLLALLPLFGLLMGGALGADPLAVLVGTPAGRACLISGLLLEAIGLVWTARITRRAEPP
jgi:tight adherence protein B